ncbi:hypothetical protein B566_EDAN010005 [Ephemera danica]|nr:hypothetical protein B566_EDAN010005 [Ephemera danica]
MRRNSAFLMCSVVVVCLALLVPDLVQARPHRQKRVSDQRLAELETLLALAKMKGKLITVPIGFGRVDPTKIGKRRRRSQQELDENRLELPFDSMDDSAEERSGSSPQYEDLLRQYLLAWARDQESI